MVTIGIDVGLAYTKAVVLEDGKLRGKAIGVSGGAQRGAHIADVVRAARADAGLAEGDAFASAATGKGKFDAAADCQATEPRAAVTAARHFYPDVRTVVSVGADETLVVTVREDGSIGEYTLNQKCAAGLGIFLEAVAHRLGAGLGELGALHADAHLAVNDGCPVFAELDVLSLLNRDASWEQAALAAIDAMAVRANTTINDITNPETGRFVLIGGLTQNEAFVKALEKRSGIPFSIPEDAAYAGAVGAALLAGAPEKTANEEQ